MYFCSCRGGGFVILLKLCMIIYSSQTNMLVTMGGMALQCHGKHQISSINNNAALMGERGVSNVGLSWLHLVRYEDDAV